MTAGDVWVDGVSFVARDARQIGQFGDAVHEDGDHVPEIAADLVQGELGILGRIVQQARGQHFRRHAQFRQDLGDRQAVIDVRFT